MESVLSLPVTLGLLQGWLDVGAIGHFIAVVLNLGWTYIVGLLFVNLYFYIFNQQLFRADTATIPALQRAPLVGGDFMETSDLKYYKGFFTPFFDIVETEFEKFSFEITKKGTPHFKSLVKASFVKCFQFNYFNSRPKEFKDSFFSLGTLRSICEDLITLSYLKKLKSKEREELIQFNLNFDITKNLIVQDAFFKKYNPGQIVINAEKYATDDYIDFVKKRPPNKKDASRLGYKTYPSVFQMAKDTKYLDLYNYLYYATSSIVHFRADTLLKMGWNKHADDYKIGKYHYSIYNYFHYYSKFNLAYGSLLFCEYVYNFKRELQLPDHIIGETEYFRSSFNLFDWPEIMTYDHMNTKGPSDIIKQLQRSYHVVKNRRQQKALRQRG